MGFDYWSMNGIYVSFKREFLEDNETLICPNCQSYILENIDLENLIFYKTKCQKCNSKIGFVKGIVKARKLGSYIRLINENKKEISIDISTLPNDFDVRKGDEILLTYLLDFYQSFPVMYINYTISEKFYLSASDAIGTYFYLMKYKNEFLNLNKGWIRLRGEDFKLNFKELNLNLNWIESEKISNKKN